MPETMLSISLPKLPNIDDTEPMNAEDQECIREVRDVLARHGRLQRFGLTLLHEHFDLASDECLLEFPNKQARTLLIKPVKKSEMVGRQSIETNWRLDSLDPTVWCMRFCHAGPSGTHDRSHGFGDE